MPPVVIAGGVAAAGAIGSAVIGSSAAKKAAKAQQQSTDAAIAEQHRQFDLNRADLEPWRTAGGSAITGGYAMLQPGYDYTASPGYQFRLDEGLRGVENSAAARGLLQSGGTLKGIDKYAEGLAAQDFNDQFNRYMSVASGGQQATQAGAQLGQQGANSIADLLTQAGNAKASGYMGQANAISQGIGGVTSAILPFIGGMGGGGFSGTGSIGLSDVRAKTDIRKVGKTDGGLNVFTYRYKGDKQMHMGVMAQEVAHKQPGALGPTLGDLLTVDYEAVH
jgi:hypothetical protein